MSCKVSAKCKLMMAALTMFVSASVFASFSDGRALGGMPKKCIGLYFDVMNTTPSNVLANADQFAKSAPYLDGVAIGLHDIPVVTSDGETATSQYRWIMHKSQRWTRDAVKSQLPYLKEIVKKPNLTESMLLFWMTPHGNHERLDWADDKAWANYAENMASVAWLAKEAGLKGLMLDPEEYGAQGGRLPQYVHTHEDPPYREAAQLARQRGREVFSRVFKEFPDAVILSLWFMSKFDFWLEDGYQPHPLQNTEQSGELLQYFLNGILDVIPPEARIVDGYEYYTGSALKNDYFCRESIITTSALPLVAPENVTKYRAQVYSGNAHYLDMYAQKSNPKSLWYYPPVNGSRLEHLRLNLEQSFRTATEYVWLYGERSGKLFNWRDGHYAKQKTWEEAIPGFTETVMLTKDPCRFAVKRKAALAKRGELINLAKDAQKMSLGVSTKALVKPPVYDRRNRRTNVKRFEKSLVTTGLNPGELYSVGLSIKRSGPGFLFIFPRFRGKGEEIKSPMYIPAIATRDLREDGVWQPGDVVVRVPEGADELYLQIKAEITNDATEIELGDFEVYKIGDPLPAWPAEFERPHERKL